MKKILHKKSAIENAKPTSSELEHGEIAINYFSGKEAIFIKNSSNNIVEIPSGTQIDTVKSTLETHINNKENPHAVTKEQIGLGRVDNTSDIDKPISRLQGEEIGKKVNITDIVDNLTTNASDQPLSAAQGIELNERLSKITGGASADLTALTTRVAAIEEEMNEAITQADIVINDSI